MFCRVMLVIVGWFCFLGSTLAQNVELKSTEADVPEVVSKEIRAIVDQTSHTIVVDGQLSSHFWFRLDPPTAASPSSELGVTFGQLEPGALIGVVELLQPWSDYKGNSIQPSVYTMRYGVMPADGNHMGVSPYRDFLLLIPAAEDTDPLHNYDYAELVSSSVGASGVPHPAVLALFPIWDEITGPTLTKNEMDQWTLAVKLGDQVLGLVLVGHGEI